MRYLFFFGCMALLSTCTTKKTVTITGQAEGFKSRGIFVEKKAGLVYRSVDTVLMDQDGSFKIRLEEDGYEYYRLNFNYSNKVEIMISGHDIDIQVDASNHRGKYTISGSPDHDLKNEVESILSGFGRLETVRKIRADYDKANKEGNIEALEEAKKRYQQAVDERDETIKQIILKGLDDGIYLGVLDVMYEHVVPPVKYPEFYRKVSEIISAKLPDQGISKQFEGYIRVVAKDARTK